MPRTHPDGDDSTLQRHLASADLDASTEDRGRTPYKPAGIVDVKPVRMPRAIVQHTPLAIRLTEPITYLRGEFTRDRVKGRDLIPVMVRLGNRRRRSWETLVRKARRSARHYPRLTYTQTEQTVSNPENRSQARGEITDGMARRNWPTSNGDVGGERLHFGNLDILHCRSIPFAEQGPKGCLARTWGQN